MNLIDLLDYYSMVHNDTDLFLMLNDYQLDERIDRENMNKIIIKELGSCRPFTTNAIVFKFGLEEFFMKYSNNISKLLDTMYLTYNPLNTKNITRNLTEDEDKSKAETEDKSKSESEDKDKIFTDSKTKTTTETEHRESTADIDNTDTYTTNTDTDIDYTTENQVSAMDATTYQPKDKTIHDETQDVDVSHSGTTTSDITSDVDTNKSVTETDSDRATTTEDNTINTTEDNSKNTTEDNTRTEIESIVGKDGELTYQELIKQERELAEFNIFNWIIKLMRKELFLLIY